MIVTVSTSEQQDDDIVLLNSEFPIGSLVEIENGKHIAVCGGHHTENNAICMTKKLRRKLGVNIGDTIKVSPQTKPLSLARRIHVITDKENLDELFEDHIKGHFLGAFRPVAKNTDFTVKGVTFKILATDPPDEFCIVAPTTRVHLDHSKNITDEDDEEFVGGYREEMKKIRELVELPLKYPQLFEKLGISSGGTPKGLLLYGPPGTGKTLIARVLARSLGAFFIVINGPEIMNKYVGDSQHNLRRVFEEAEKQSPSIIFIDEIDSIAPKREKTVNDTEKQVVTQLLTLMDGMSQRSQVVVMAATNRPQALDPALRRFGRFDCEVKIGIPNEEGRGEILKIHTRNMSLSREFDLREIASLIHGYVGSDIQHLCTEAAMECAREVGSWDAKEYKIERKHFDTAMQKIKPSSLRSLHTEVPTTRWEDVGGLDEIKKEIHNILSVSPKEFLKFNIKPPYGGILLHGPPGCGKTLIAKAIASEYRMNFIGIKGSDLLTMWFGESEANIREIFAKARDASPCVIFFDEIDSIAASRSSVINVGGPSDKILNQLLAEMDGLNVKSEIFVIGATNRLDILDSAILRPGRFEFLFYIGLPDLASRVSIVKSIFRKTVDKEEGVEDFVAQRTDGYSGADLFSACQKMCRNAIAENSPTILKTHFTPLLKPSVVTTKTFSSSGAV